MDELELVHDGRLYRISMTKAAAKVFRKVDAAKRARIVKWMTRFADDGFEYLDNEKLNHEGRFAVGDRAGTEVAILAFKAWQVRVCGGVVGGNHFIATEVDASKKQDKADRALLERSAKKLLPYVGGE